MWGKDLRINAGVRLLQTDQTISGYVTDPGEAKEYKHYANNYTEALPSVNLALDLRDDVVLRAAASKTMTRPAPGDLAPGQTLSFNGDQLTRGNPELKPYFSDNLDLGLEWYFAKRGTVSVNLWQKKVQGFTIVRNRQRPFGELGININALAQVTRDSLTALGGGDPNNALVNVAMRENSDEIITLRGVEVSWLMPLDFLVRGLGINANYTYISQKSSETQPQSPGYTGLGAAVTGLSPNTFNVTAYYERGRYSARTSFNYRDPYVSALGPQNNFPGDIWRIATYSLDASFSVRLNDTFKLTVEAGNLLNDTSLTYVNQDKSLPWGGNAPGRNYAVGLQATF